MMRGCPSSSPDSGAGPDGRTLASGSQGGTVRLWDLRQPGATPVVLRGHEGSVFSVAFAPDGAALASAGEDAAVFVWDLRRPGAAPVILSGHTSRANVV